MRAALLFFLIALFSPIAFAASGGKMDANFLLLVIATILWFISAVPVPEPWRGYSPNLVALGLFFFGLSLVVA